MIPHSLVHMLILSLIGAVNIPMGHFMAQYDGTDERVTLLKGKNIVVYCQGGVRSQIVAEAIKKVRRFSIFKIRSKTDLFTYYRPVLM